MKIIAISNIKGGVGKTTTAVNLAFLCAANPGKRELNELVIASAYDRLDILPADFSYRHFDVHLSSR